MDEIIIAMNPTQQSKTQKGRNYSDPFYNITASRFGLSGEVIFYNNATASRLVDYKVD